MAFRYWIIGTLLPVFIALGVLAAYLTVKSQVGFFPVHDTDSLLYLDLAGAANRHQTTLDSHHGRPVGWPGAVTWTIRSLSTAMPVETAGMVLPVFYLILFAPIGAYFGIKAAGRPGLLLYTTALFLPSVIWTWSPARPDHHAILSVILVVAALIGWCGSIPSKYDLFFGTSLGLLSGAMVWLSPLAAVPAIACLWCALRISRVGFPWLLVGTVAFTTHIVLWNIEGAPFPWWRLEIANPLWASLLLAAGCLLAIRKGPAGWVAPAVGMGITMVAFTIAWQTRADLVFLNPQWDVLASQIVEMQVGGVVSFIQEAFLPLALLAIAMVFSKTPRHGIAAGFTLLCLIGSGMVAQRLSAVIAPLSLIAGLACMSPRWPRATMAALAVPILIGSISVVSFAMGFKESEYGRRLAAINDMKAVVSGATRALAPIDEGVAFAYLTGVPVEGSLFWENLETNSARNAVLMAPATEIPEWINCIVWPAGYMEEFAWGGVLYDKVPKANSDCLMLNLAASAPIPGFERVPTPFFSEERAYFVYLRRD